MNERTHVDLFTGLGGFTIAAHANGVRTIAMCEIDLRCRSFLAKAWPGVPVWDDVRTFRLADARYAESNSERRDVGEERSIPKAQRRSEHCTVLLRGERVQEPVWLLTAGVPCQPASRAGKQRGEKDDRWLWPATLAVLGDLLPTWALLENPPGIGDMDFAGILSQVAAHGYETRVLSIPACAVGAPHRRERYWIVAYRESGTVGTGLCAADTGRERGRRSGDGDGERVADAAWDGQRGESPQEWTDGERVRECVEPCDVADAEEQGINGKSRYDNGSGGSRNESQPQLDGGNPWADSIWLPCADGKVRRAPGDSFGLVDGLHRSVLAALGNSIVWPVAARIIAAMIEAEEP